jgi:hypothetical protein
MSDFCNGKGDSVCENPVYEFPGGIGDQLLCSAVGEALSNNGRLFRLITSHPDFFTNNPNCEAIDSKSEVAAELRKNIVLNLSYGNGFSETDEGDRYQDGHIIEAMCRRAGARGNISLRPVVYFSSNEPRSIKDRPPKIVIQSSNVGAKHYYPLKDWYADRFSMVADELSRSYEVVQVGSILDPAITNATDLRGRADILETYHLLTDARLYIGMAGFIMHLARAAETPAVIVYGGREDPTKTGYPCNRNLFSAIPCAPCYRRARCPYDKECMQRITTQQVIRAAIDLLNDCSFPLATDYALVS